MDERIDLPERAWGGRLAVEVAAHEAIVGDAEVEGSGAGVLTATGPCCFTRAAPP